MAKAKKPTPWREKLRANPVALKTFYIWTQIKRPFYKNKINPSPVFILGNQKSGTTVIAESLASLSGKSCVNDIKELFLLVPHRALLSGKVTVEEVIKKFPEPFSKEIIKEPTLTFVFEQLYKIFPAAKWVFIVRDPRDNIRSILNRIKVPGHLTDLNVEEYNVDPFWKHIFDTSIWGFDGCKNYIDILAYRWDRAVEVYLNNKKIFHLLKYEDFLKDKVGTIIKLAKGLNLPVKHDISQVVNTQFQVKGQKDISWLDFFGEENLKIIEERCAEYMKEFGYDVRL